VISPYFIDLQVTKTQGKKVLNFYDSFRRIFSLYGFPQ